MQNWEYKVEVRIVHADPKGVAWATRSKGEDGTLDAFLSAMGSHGGELVSTLPLRTDPNAEFAFVFKKARSAA